MLRKIYNNLGPEALHVLGFRQYFYMLLGVMRHFPTIMRTKKLMLLDKWMSKLLTVRVRNHRFKIDCRYIDQTLPEDSYTFGLIREIYVSQCYFQFDDLPDKMENVVDLGGNRGVFSLLTAQFSKNVIYVEAQKPYQQSVLHNAILNGLSNIQMINAYIGDETALRKGDTPSKLLDDIIK